MAEFDLIERIRVRAMAREGVLLGIGDDAAVLHVPAGHELVVTADTLNAGVHFPLDAAPARGVDDLMGAHRRHLLHRARASRPFSSMISLSLSTCHWGSASRSGKKASALPSAKILVIYTRSHRGRNRR